MRVLGKVVRQSVSKPLKGKIQNKLRSNYWNSPGLNLWASSTKSLCRTYSEKVTKNITESSLYTTVPILTVIVVWKYFATVSITTLLGDTTAATLAALPRLPPLLLPSWLTIPPWLGWLSSCCITRLFTDGSEQEMCGSEYRKCRVGEGDMDKQFWL